MAPWTPTPLFEEIRLAVKERSRAGDVAMLLAWLLQHYMDDGLMRSPSTKRRSIILDDVKYWLVRAHHQPANTNAAASPSTPTTP